MKSKTLKTVRNQLQKLSDIEYSTETLIGIRVQAIHTYFFLIHVCLSHLFPALPSYIFTFGASQYAISGNLMSFILNKFCVQIHMYK